MAGALAFRLFVMTFTGCFMTLQLTLATGHAGQWRAWTKDADTQGFGNVRDPVVYKNTLTAFAPFSTTFGYRCQIVTVDEPALSNSHFALINDIVLASDGTVCCRASQNELVPARLTLCRRSCLRRTAWITCALLHLDRRRYPCSGSLAARNGY